MTGSIDLERGYRRLLACYPPAYRHENGQEILGVLMDGAREGQKRPRLAESAALIRSALRMRLRPGASQQEDERQTSSYDRGSSPWIVVRMSIVFLIVVAVGLVAGNPNPGAWVVAGCVLAMLIAVDIVVARRIIRRHRRPV